MPSPRTVLITGCSPNSIGSALALAFTPHAHVFATARSLQNLSHLSTHPHITLLALDVTSPASIAAAHALVASKITELGGSGLDILVNSAGRGYVTPLLDADLAEAKRVFDVNVWGALAMVQAFGAMLREKKGCVANVGSIGGEVPDPFRGIYGASKSALALLGETLRLELAPFAVRVVTLVTGVIRTPFTANIPPNSLPAHSIYLPIKAEIEHVAADGNLPRKTEVGVYAERVVRDLLGGANRRVWRGELTGVVRWVVRVVPVRWVDSILTRNTGLDKLAGMVKGWGSVR